MSGQAVKVIGVSLATAPAGNAAVDIRVQVSGAVMLPGAYRMNPGDRVIDAIAAAGGVAPDADLSGVNLSMRVQDETCYHIPVFREVMPTIPSTAAKTGARNGGLIDPNTAQSRELETLPGIGRVLSGAIVS